MKNIIRIPLLLLLFTAVFASAATAQLREDARSSADLTGPVVGQHSMEAGSWENLFNMHMSHSYEMMFSSFGGSVQNVNAYTNTMRFAFTDRLSGRVDLSLMHSPFGNSMIGGNTGGLGAEFLIRNAELNYELSDRSSIHLRFQQIPAMGMNPGSYYANPFYRPYGSPFGNY
ncbi:MAG: hypothetical protein U5K31_06175 [Balneolaceae bacterium]|nr:hypothetical protein [Balneolaceae bacterium]